MVPLTGSPLCGPPRTVIFSSREDVVERRSQFGGAHRGRERVAVPLKIASSLGVFGLLLKK